MYSSLHPSQQSKVFTPTQSGSRKCVLATNIAETSITIPGIKYVIDTGKCKERRYIAREPGNGRYAGWRKTISIDLALAGVDTLLTRDISKSSAMQRAGRAGREVCVHFFSTRSFWLYRQGEGFCFRLFPKYAFDSMVPALEPEIRRCDLTAVILELKCLRLDLEELDFVDKPDEEAGQLIGIDPPTVYSFW
jgi:HrpA-like RNA helicase